MLFLHTRSPGRNRYEAVLGEHDRYEENIHRRQSSFASIHIHPNYNSNTEENDIALVKLSTQQSLTDYIFPACSPGELSLYTGVECVVSGWGYTGPGECTIQCDECDISTLCLSP